jgi:hypothetical protein
MYRKYGADAPMGCAGRPSDSDRQQEGAERHSRDNIHLRINFRLGVQRSMAFGRWRSENSTPSGAGTGEEHVWSSIPFTAEGYTIRVVKLESEILVY